MEILITVTDKTGEITIRRDKEGKRWQSIYESPPINEGVLDDAIDLIEREAK